MLFKFQRRVSPAQVVISGFAALILVGTVLLMLPFSTQHSGGASFMDALFTATSATCVTGLVVQDTALYWSQFGQAVILLLIQIGGMGVVTLALAISLLTGRRIGLRERQIMQESIAAPQVAGIVRMTGFLIRWVLVIEGIGALLLSFRFIPLLGPIKGLWYSIFHAISAFCNAGFDLLGMQTPFSSLTAFSRDPLMNGVIMVLIVLGGLGFVTWSDVGAHKLRLRAYRFQSKLILLTTALLLLGGAFFFYFYEFAQPQWAALGGGERVLAALLASVSPRTAGFNTVDLTQFGSLALLATMLLMLVGGSPGSTAGGFKTTTLAVLLMNVWAVIRRRRSVEGFGRRLPEDVLRRAATIFTLYLLLFLLGGALIAGIEGVPLSAALFEAASAIGTVGLSLSLTPTLGTASHLILIFLMYFGRAGGLTLIFAVVLREGSPGQLPQEHITVG